MNPRIFRNTKKTVLNIIHLKCVDTRNMYQFDYQETINVLLDFIVGETPLENPEYFPNCKPNQTLTQPSLTSKSRVIAYI